MRRIISILTAFSLTLISLSFFNSSNVNAKVNEPIEVVSLRSEYGKQFDNGDGTITSYISTVPIHYFENNEWMNIDNTLINDENGNICNKSNSTKITIPSIINTSNRNEIFNNQFTIKHDNYSLSMSLIDTSFFNKDTEERSTAEIKNDITDKSEFQHDIFAKLANDSCNLFSNILFDFPNNDYRLNLSVTPNSLIEYFEFNSPFVSTQLSYYISSDNLIAIETDNTIQFEDKNNDNIVFFIPQIYFEDSSNEAKRKIVATDISQVDNGYILSLTLDSDWLYKEADYPIRLISEVTTNINASTFYISSAAPTTCYSNVNIKIGGGTVYEPARYETIINKPIFIPNVSDMIAIKDAKLFAYMFNNTSPGYNNTIKVCTINEIYTYPQWISCGDNISCTQISETQIPNNANLGYYSFDITKGVQADLNYVRSGSFVGSYCYGFKLTALSSRVFTGYSERYSPKAPYFEITYVTNSSYEMANTPNKYNNILNNPKIYNFQNRMNCYAYALQVYYRSYNPDASYLLRPGEFGISQPDTNYNISNYEQLKAYYSQYCNDIKAAYMGNNTMALSAISKYYMNFIEKQMLKDAATLNFSLTPLDSYSSPYYTINNDFSLPSDFNPKMTDEMLTGAILNILNTVIANPSLIEAEATVSDYIPASEIRCKQAEIDRAIDNGTKTAEEIRNDILRLAGLKYKHCTYSDVNQKTELLKSLIDNRNQLNTLDIGLLRSCVKRITVSHFCVIEAEFINGVIIKNETERNDENGRSSECKDNPCQATSG